MYWFVAILVLYSALSALSFWQHQRTVEAEYDNALRILEQEFVTILSGYETAARLLYEEYRLRPDFIEPVSQAAHARRDFGSQPGTPSTEVEDTARRQLYELLLPVYTRLGNLGFRQLHIHMPDNSSFLRMHSPELYGDDLSGFRATVEQANRELRFVRGFEEGRVFNGYRFVIPLFELGTQPSERSPANHIGSVEIGVGFATLIGDLSNLFDKHYNFVLRRDIVESTVFEEYHGNYSDWWFSPKFVEDADSECDCMLPELFSDSANARLRERIQRKLENLERFAVHIPHNREDYLLSLLPVQNKDGQPVGYFQSLELRPSLGSYRRSLTMILVILTGTVVVIAVLGLQLIRHGRNLEYMAGHDQLTGLLNRRMFEELFQRARAEQNRNGKAMALIILDIDHFKRINDRRGHIYGDKVLIELSTVLTQHVRAGDVVARWGGEEFIILLRSIEYGDAVRVAENLRASILESTHAHMIDVTASFGVVQVPLNEEPMDVFVSLADERLYRAKESGRNKVVSDDT